AFVAFTLDLAKRSAPVSALAPASATQASASGSRTTALLERLATDAPPPGGDDATEKPPASRVLKVAMALAVLGWVVHVAATVMRGIAAGRVPWANMYEFS